MNTKGSKLYDTILLYDSLKKQKSFSPFSYGLNVVKTLTAIYGEVDIINPVKLGNYDAFKSNIMKYVSEDDYNRFINCFNSLPDNCINNEDNIDYLNNSFVKNPTFDIIQELLDKMMEEKNKKIPMNDSEKKNISNSMYVPDNENLNFYSFALCYFENQMKKKRNNINGNQKIIFSSDRKDYLKDQFYESIGLDPNWVKTLDDDQLSEVNKYVKKQLKNDDNNGGVERGRVLSKLPAAVSSGSGFVDALLLAGVLATIVLIIMIVYICLK